MSGRAWVSDALLGTHQAGGPATTELMRRLQDYVLLDGHCHSLPKSAIGFAPGPQAETSLVESVGPYLQFAAEKVPSVALQFCDALANRSMTCPLSALPEVLTLGMKHPDTISPVLGPRGQWLASLHPQAALLFAPITASTSDQDAPGGWTLETLSQALHEAPPEVRGMVFRRMVDSAPRSAIKLALDRWSGEVTQFRLAILRAVRHLDFSISSPLVDLGLEERTPEVQDEARKVAALRSPKFQQALEDSFSQWLMDPTSRTPMPLDWSFRLLPPSTTIAGLGGWDALTTNRFSPSRQNELINSILEAALLHQDGTAVRNLSDRLDGLIDIPVDALKLLDREDRQSLIHQWIMRPPKSRPERLLSAAVRAHRSLDEESSHLIGREVVRAANQPPGGSASTVLKGEEFALALHLDIAEELLDRLNGLPLSPREHLRRVWVPILHLRLKLFRTLDPIS